MTQERDAAKNLFFLFKTSKQTITRDVYVALVHFCDLLAARAASVEAHKRVSDVWFMISPGADESLPFRNSKDDDKF
jgi:hypothetical protein